MSYVIKFAYIVSYPTKNEQYMKKAKSLNDAKRQRHPYFATYCPGWMSGFRLLTKSNP